MNKFIVFHKDMLTDPNCAEPAFFEPSFEAAEKMVAAEREPHNWVIAELTNMKAVKQPKLAFVQYKG